MSPPTILTVDDNALTRKLVRVALGGAGYQVMEAEDGAAALAALRQHRPDLVLMDLVLPDVDGLTLFGWLRAEEAGRDVPIVAMSGFQSELALAEEMRLGFTSLLFKPVEPSRLVNVIESLVPVRPGASSDVGAGRRVLVVDDDPVELKLTRIHLEQIGFQVTALSDPTRAVEAALRLRPDAVVSDVLMPGLDGFRLCHALKQDPAVARIPVVLSSVVFTDQADRAMARRAGAAGLALMTPDRREMVDALVEALDGQWKGAAEPQPPEPLGEDYLDRMVRQLDRQAQQNLTHAHRTSWLQSELGILASVTSGASPARSLPEALRDLLEACVEGSGLSTGAIFLLGTDGRLHLEAHIGVPAALVERGDLQRLFERLRLTDDPQLLDGADDPSGPAARLMRPLRARSALLVPLISNGARMGALLLCSSVRTLDDGWVAFARAVGNYMAQAVVHAQLMRELAQAEARFRSLAETAPVGIFELNQNGDCVYTNPRWQAMTGLTAEESAGRRWRKAVHPDDLEALGASWGRTIVQDLDMLMDARVVDPRGAVRWVTFRVRPRVSGDGEQMGAVGTVVDITERRLMEEALRASEERYRQIVETAQEGIWMVDAEGRTTFVNARLAEMLGYSAEEMMGASLFDFMDEEVRAAAEESMDRRRHRVAEQHDFRLQRKDGTDLWVSLAANPLPDPDGAYVGALAMVSDLTARRRAEEQLRLTEEQLRQTQKMEAIGLLAGGVAHDFNNVLTAILGFGELLHADLDPRDPRRAHAEEILEAGGRAQELVAQLMAFSRHQPAASVRLDLNQTMAGTTRLLERLLGEDIELIVTADPEACPVELDQGRVEQVVINLAVNARDAMPEGGTLSIETANVVLDSQYVSRHLGMRPGQYVLLTVRDTGHGMDPETQARVFEPFFTTKPVGRGTGLGLSTVYGIVKASDGHIWVYSEPGRGTEFKIYFPRAKSSVGPDQPLAPETELPRGSETVLLVEDDSGVRLLAGQVLRSLGYDVIEAASGEEALIAARAEKSIDVLVTDMVMPTMGGREVADQLARRYPRLKTLFMSGFTADTALRQRSLDGGHAFLQKPFTPRSLATSLRAVLDSSTREPAAGRTNTRRRSMKQ